MSSPAVSKGARALEAAIEVFTRYGYARTTMGDIAAKAGMSRPALYLIYLDKEEAFARVVERMDTRKLVEIEDALANINTLEGKLLRACLDWGLHGIELAAAHPDAADLFDLRFAPVRQVYANFEALVTGLIAQPVARVQIVATAEELARTLVYGMRGMRDATSNVEEMRRLVTVQVETFVRAIEGPR